MYKSTVLLGSVIQSMICADSESRDFDGAINHSNKRFLFPPWKYVSVFLTD